MPLPAKVRYPPVVSFFMYSPRNLSCTMDPSWYLHEQASCRLENHFCIWSYVTSCRVKSCHLFHVIRSVKNGIACYSVARITCAYLLHIRTDWCIQYTPRSRTAKQPDTPLKVTRLNCHVKKKVFTCIPAVWFVVRRFLKESKPSRKCWWRIPLSP